MRPGPGGIIPEESSSRVCPSVSAHGHWVSWHLVLGQTPEKLARLGFMSFWSNRTPIRMCGIKEVDRLDIRTRIQEVGAGRHAREK